MKKYHNFYLILVAVIPMLMLSACASLDDCCDEDPIILQDTIKLPPVVIEDTAGVKKDYRVTIQIGAFKDKSNADQWMQDTRDKLGSRDVIVRLDPLDGNYKVTVGIFDNVEAANAYLSTVISRGYNDAFVRDYRQGMAP